MSNINQEYIEDYIRNHLPNSTGLVRELEKYARAHHVPIIHPEVAQLITLVLRAQNSRQILEIGTAIGYSSIVFSQAMGKKSQVITIEREQDMVSLARENIKKAGLQDNISILEGQAEEILPTLEGPFDCVFLDAAKGHYMDFLPHCLSLIKGGGLLISDNVLFRGMVASDTLVKRRKITIVKRMRRYLECITNHSNLNTSIIPIGDGLAISLKRSENN